MATVIGKAVIPVTLDTSGFNREMARIQGSSSSGFSKVGAMAKRAAVTGVAALGVAAGAAAVKAVSLEAAFTKSLNQVQAATGATGKQMDNLSNLAIKLGRDTVFSAGDAADAMLELAKGGMKPATIQAGALKASMDLAAAGGMKMGEAANTMVRAMGAFGLKGKEAGQVANALAGAANASSSDVNDLSFALSQSGLAAHASGMSIQETTAALAAFANQGLIGSDAGTSLKTMLSNLVPIGDTANGAFAELGLTLADGSSKFVKANGEFKSMAQIAGILDKATRDLTESEKQHQLRLAFGSDAFRAALALSNEGAAGMKKYQKATSDSTAAQKMAAAQMKGTAGAIEQLKGSFETVLLQFGILIRPAVVAGLGLITKFLNQLSLGMSNLSSAGAGSSKAMDSFAQTGKALQGFFNDLMPTVQRLIDDFKREMGPALQNLGNTITNDLLPAFRAMLPVLEPIAKLMLKMWGKTLISSVTGLVQIISGVVKVIANMVNLVDDLIHGRWKQAWGDLVGIVMGAVTAVGGAFKALTGNMVFRLIGEGLKALGGLFKSTFDLILKVVTGTMKAIVSSVTGPMRVMVNAATTGMKGIQKAVQAAWPAIRKIFSTSLNAIGKALSTAFNGFKKVFSTGFNAIKSATKAAWGFIERIFKTAFSAISRLIRAEWEGWKRIFKASFGVLKSVTSTVWSAMKQIWSSAFNAVKNTVSTAWTAIKRFFTNAFQAVRTTTTNGINAVRTAVSNGMNAVKNTAQNVLNALGNAFKHVFGEVVPNAVRGGVSAVRNIWGNIKSAVSGPVNAVKSIVGGLIGKFNAVLRFLKLPTIPGFARGGVADGTVIPGYTPGRDVHTFVSPTGGALQLSGGEAIMRPEFTRRVGGKKGVDRINRAARLGLAFASGGIYPTPSSGSYDANDSGGGRYSRDIAVPTGTPVHAYRGGKVIAVQHSTVSYGNAVWVRAKGGGVQIYAHLSRTAVRRGQKIKKGQVIGAVGHSGNATGPHLHFELRGGGSATVGAGAKGSGKGKAVAQARKQISKLQALFGKLPGLPNIDVPGPFGSMLKSMVKMVWTGAKNYVGSKIKSAINAIKSAIGKLISSGPNVSNQGKKGYKAYARQQMGTYGWRGKKQWNALNKLWQAESGWSKTADNPDSSAYGIPQGLTDTHGLKGTAYMTSAAAQINWGLAYIKRVYGSPAAAWAAYQSRSPHWYDEGGILQGPGLFASGTNKPERVLSPRQTEAFETFVHALDVMTSRSASAVMSTSAAAGGRAVDGGGYPTRVELVVEGRRFSGYIRGIAGEAVGSANSYSARRGRMG